MSSDNQQRVNFPLSFLFVLLFVLFADAAVAEDHERTRRITVEPLRFQIDVPAWWKVTLNERLRGKAFLTIQGTASDGRVIPATLSAIYNQPTEGKRFPKLPDPEDYAAIYAKLLKGQLVDAEIVRAERVEVDGYVGVLLEWRHTSDEVAQRTVQINVVPADGNSRFIFTYATFEEHAKVDMPYLHAILQTVRLKSFRLEPDKGN